MRKRLTYIAGNSAKEYIVEATESSEGWSVTVAYGRIGSASTTLSKTPTPVDEAEAIKLFNQLCSAKERKGYVHDGVTAEFPELSTQTVSPVQTPVFLPQLATAIAPDALLARCESELIGAQIKRDGVRQILIWHNGEAQAINRRGFPVVTNRAVLDAFTLGCRLLGYESLILDCEAFNAHNYVFDVLEIDGKPLVDEPFEKREHTLRVLRVTLADVLDDEDANRFDWAMTWWSHRHDFAQLIEHCRAAGEEGLIFRRADAGYVPGKGTNPATADVLKIKNVNDLSAIVIQTAGAKRSVRLGLLDKRGEIQDVGACTIPVNHALPELNAVVDVTYLWILNEGGSLVQPVYKGDRSDEISREDCTLDQVVYRSDAILEAG